MADFDSVWSKLVQYAKENPSVHTFVRESENRLEYDAEQDAIVFKSETSDPIARETWESAWEELHRNGELTIDSFKQATGTFRASASLPFLAEALDLPHDASKRRIWISEDSEDT